MSDPASLRIGKKPEGEMARAVILGSDRRVLAYDLLVAEDHTYVIAIDEDNGQWESLSGPARSDGGLGKPLADLLREKGFERTKIYTHRLGTIELMELDPAVEKGQMPAIVPPDKSKDLLAHIERYSAYLSRPPLPVETPGIDVT